MNIKRIRSIAIASFFFVCLHANAEETSPRTYLLPENGYLELQVPISWHEQIIQPTGILPPIIKFSLETNSYFQVFLTPVFAVDKITIPTESEIRAGLRKAAESYRSLALEKSIAIIKIQGSTSVGYYFSVTDKAPKPDEYDIMTQGTFLTGNLAPSITVLSNFNSTDAVAMTLEMLGSAKHIKKTL